MTNPMDTANRRVTKVAFGIGGAASVGAIIALIGLNFGPQPTLALIGVLIILAAGTVWITESIVVSTIVIKAWWRRKHCREEQGT